MGIPNDPEEQLAPLRREAHAWVARFAAGSATAADIEALKEWHGRSPEHAEAFAKASRLWDALGSAGQADSLKNAFEAHTQRSAFAQSRHIGRRAVLAGTGAIAASAAGYAIVRPPLGLWPSLSELTADYRTATGEQKHINLAEGISIQMNARTSIAVRSIESGARNLELIAGQAAIATGPGTSNPIVLIAKNGRTVASTASFDVRYIGETVCVTCLEGEIRVEQGITNVPVGPRQQLLYSSRDMSSIRAIDPAVVTAWRDGVLIFHGTPLAEAVEEINRYRPGKIIVTNDTLGRRLFNARFRVENVEAVIDQIRQVFGARTTTLPGGIVLLS